jgi:hypothetical protein
MAVLGSARGAVCSLLVHDLNGRVRPSGASARAKNAIAVESCGKRDQFSPRQVTSGRNLVRSPSLCTTERAFGA